MQIKCVMKRRISLIYLRVDLATGQGHQKKWRGYHPSHDDYQAEGACCRMIFRCLNVGTRQRPQTENLLDKYRSNTDNFDCVVPVSGGKDVSYVAYTLKHKHGMNPLTITIKPALSLDIGDKNLFNFIQSVYSHMHISCNPVVLDHLNKYGFIEKGFPYYGWLIRLIRF